MCSLLLAGCSVSTIHPPSASAFMEKSEDAFLTNVSFSASWGENLNREKGLYVAEGVKEVDRSEKWKEDWHYVDKEWLVQLQGSLQRSIGYFKYGFGMTLGEMGFQFNVSFIASKVKYTKFIGNSRSFFADVIGKFLAGDVAA